jgi:GTP-binding protein Era
MDPAPSSHRAGFCAIVGRANVGKSTLVNRLVGSKVAIVTPKAQTTRHRILGVVEETDAQAVLVDTPGLVLGQAPLPKALRRMARGAAADADVVVLVVNLRRGEAALDENDQAVLHAARRSPAARIVAVNKVDLLPDKRVLLPWMAAWSAAEAGEVVVPISARTGEGLSTLWGEMMARLPQGPALFPKDMHTDQSERSLCGEFVREQLLLRLQQEVPHSAAVVVERFEDGRAHPERPICRIWARIVVERTGQKAIVIGHGGETLKAIGQAARRNIERMLGCQVYLRLDVKVDAAWTSRAEVFGEYGIVEGTA